MLEKLSPVRLLQFLLNYWIILMTCLDEPQPPESIHPVMSAGVHGGVEGQGFTLYYNNHNQLSAVVKTNDTFYKVAIPVNDVSADTIRSFTMTWRKNELKIYENAELLRTDNGILYAVENVTGAHEPINMYEYILVLGSYHLEKSYAYGNFLNFQIWKEVLDPVEDANMFAPEVTCMLSCYSFSLK